MCVSQTNFIFDLFQNGLNRKKEAEQSMPPLSYFYNFTKRLGAFTFSSVKFYMYIHKIITPCNL